MAHFSKKNKTTPRLKEAFLHNARHRCNIGPGKILVALSGGPDSVALLHLLHGTRDELGIEPVVAHVNHQLRQNAAADAAFCREVAEKLGLVFSVKKAPVREYAREHKMSLETAARALRYRALEEIAAETGCGDIALGHTADDQAETVLQNMLRGSGPRGLAGMLFRHENRVRPLLTISRQEILSYLQENNLPYVEDETNRQLRYQRNRIRHEILPILRAELNPEVSSALNRIAGIQQEVEAFLRHEAAKALKLLTKQRFAHKIILDIEQFRGYFTILRTYVLRLALEQLAQEELRLHFHALQRADTLALQGAVGKSVTIHQGWEVLRDHDGLVVWQRKKPAFEIACRPETRTHFGERFFITISRLEHAPKSWKEAASANHQFVDADQIEGPMILRPAKPGDRFTPLGMQGRKKLSDFLTDLKVPLHRRAEIPVLECDRGIIWVVGQRIDERFRVTEATQHIYELVIEGMDS